MDVIVGRHAWPREAIQRAESVGERGLRAVTTADLVLLKLYAGGSPDRWDIEQLRASDVSGEMGQDVEHRLEALPPRCRMLWSQLRG